MLYEVIVFFRKELNTSVTPEHGMIEAIALKLVKYFLSNVDHSRYGQSFFKLEFIQYSEAVGNLRSGKNLQ